MTALRLAAAKADKLSKAVQGRIVQVELNGPAALAARRCGWIIGRVLMIGHSFLEYFLGQDGKSAGRASMNIGGGARKV
jgi:hypothetical protein